MLTLGTAIGGICKTHNPRDALRFVREAGFRAVELSDKNENAPLVLTYADIKDFEYVSFHAPTFPYANDPASRELLQRIEKIHDIRPLDCVVFHPDTVRDLSIFLHATFPVAFENMDWRKATHRTVEDMQRLMDYDSRFKFVLDLNHVHTNDDTLALGKKFYDALGSRLTEIHLSGFAGLHEPLFQTKQDTIINLIQDFSVPIILEGTGAPEELLPERLYVEHTAQEIIRRRAHMTRHTKKPS
ncbi:MAG: sugar phosphate isomerase/epimerase [Patescibacteria group bacterium]|nr:sugar phosphate isomerase/epimerase [Patescibacteria group bacterium]